MKVVLAKNSGFCYGVKRAVDSCIDIKKKFKDKKVYTLGPLIHNNDVVNFLKSKNIYAIELSDIDGLKENDIIVIRSHGVPLEVLNKLKEKKFNILDATCPYVSNIQKKVQKYYKEGYSIVIVGDKNHPEVIGINGWCENSAIISKNGENLEYLPNKVCLVSQTTEKKEHWEKILNIVNGRCKEVVAFNTICSATEVRQKCANELSKEVEAMVVVGGKNSSNTTKLYEICKSNCENTIHVENLREIPKNFSQNFSTIGVTAGASTPDWIIKEAILAMSENNMESNEQLEYMNNNDVHISIGQKVKGEVITITDKEAFVNIGYKADALLPLSEITKEDDVDICNLISKGDTIECKVINLGSDTKPPIISMIELKREDAYKELEKVFQDKETITVKVREVVNGGLIGLYKNIIRVFIPASHIELRHVDDLQQYIGQEITVNILEFEKTRNKTKIVVSRRDILKKKQLELEENAWNSLNEGDIVEGEVKVITTFGAFVNVQGIDGLLHISEMSWGRIQDPANILKVGDVIKVSIKNIDKENKKLGLSLKALTADPWESADTKYPVGSIVLGKVVRFSSFGAFIELEPGVDGMVHISQISHKRVEKIEDELSIGEEIKAKIINVDKETKKIGLSIKEVNDI